MQNSTASSVNYPAGPLPGADDLLPLESDRDATEAALTIVSLRQLQHIQGY